MNNIDLVNRGGKRNNPLFDNADTIDRTISFAIANKVPIVIPQGDWYTSRKTIVPTKVSIRSYGILIYTNLSNSGLVIGSEDEANYDVDLKGLRVRQQDINWTNSSIGIELLNLSTCCNINIHNIQGFKIGLQCHASGVTKPRSCMYNTLTLGSLINNQIGINLHSSMESSSPNSNVFTGGRIGLWSNCPKMEATGVLFSSSGDGYKGHNNNVFIGQSIELNHSLIKEDQNLNKTNNSIPIKMNCGTRNRFIGVRHETHNTDIDVYEDEAGMNEYEFLWAQKKNLVRTTKSIKSSIIISAEDIKPGNKKVSVAPSPRV